MPLVVFEKFHSRQHEWSSQSSTSDSVELGFIVHGTDDDAAAKQAVIEETPTSHGGFARSSCHLEPIGPQLWEASVRYGRPEAQQPQTKQTGEASFTFDTTGGTQHITHSLATVQRRGRKINGDSTTPSNWKQAIGVNLDGQPEGLDITVPVFAFQVTKYLAAANLSGAYVTGLYQLTGSVNAGNYSLNIDGVPLTFAEGELLFLGAAGSKRGAGDWELSFKFAASPNVVGLVIGDIDGVNKKGWEYLWVRYVQTPDPTTGALVTVPKEAHVEKVYELKDFAGLGL